MNSNQGIHNTRRNCCQLIGDITTAYNAVGYQSVCSNEVSIITSLSQYLLLTSKPGTGQGTESGSGISCGDTCLAVYNAGTVVTLSGTADPGSTFDGWTGWGCSGTGHTTPSEPLRKAIDYALNQRKALCRYLGDGRLRLDNNLAENAMRLIPD